MNNSYKTCPTIVVGLGGMGSTIVDKLSGKASQDNREFFCIDSDIGTFSVLENTERVNTISMNIPYSLSDILSFSGDRYEWIPPQLRFQITRFRDNSLRNIRLFGRLLYEESLQEGRFHALLKTAGEMAESAGSYSEKMRIDIVTSLFGATGSGFFLQIAMLLRNYIRTLYPNLDLEIHGDFVLPESSIKMYPSEMITTAKGVTYASFMELEAINSYIINNSQPVILKYRIDQPEPYVDCLPYDYCFIHDFMPTYNRFTEIDNVVSCIYERLFGDNADSIYEEFIHALKMPDRKYPHNLYGIVTAGKHGIPDCYIFRNGKIIKRTINDTCSINMEFGIDICSFFEEKKEYFSAYNEMIKELDRYLTPHLDKDWHIQLPWLNKQADNDKKDVNVFEKAKSKSIIYEKPVFISYTSKDSDIAYRTKDVLERNGFKCWMAPQSIPGGSNYDLEIPKAIDNCMAMVVLLSGAINDSVWVPKEVIVAIDKKKTVIPFQIDDSFPSSTFGLSLSNVQRIYACNRIDEAYKDLIECLRALY